MTNNMASGGLWENVIVNKNTLATDGIIECKSDTWCQIVWHLMLVQDHIPTCAVWCWHKISSCLHPCATGRGCRPSAVRNLSEGYLKWREGVLNRTSSHMWDNWNLSMFLLRDGSLTLKYIAPLIVLVMLGTSLPTMEKLFTLVWWPVVLALS